MSGDNVRKDRARLKYAEKPYVFRGLIKCADCGCAITSDTKTKPSGKTYTYLFCSHFKGNCTQPAVNENVLFQQIQDEILKKLSFPRDIMQEVAKCLTNISRAENAYALAEIDNLRKKQDALKAKRSRLLDFLLAGSITQEEYADKKNDIEKELYDVSVRLEAHSKADDEFITTVEIPAGRGGPRGGIIPEFESRTKTPNYKPATFELRIER